MSKINIPRIFDTIPSRIVKKGEVLVESGKTSSSAFYVVEGCLKSYLVDKDGKEHIYQFAPEDWMISDLEFFKNKGKALLSIKAIEPSIVKEIDVNLLYSISSNEKDVIDHVLIKFRNRIYSLQKRVIYLLAYSAEDRYVDFIKTYPNLVNRVPLYMIASYLGVTAESLSRVRKNLVKKH